MNADDEIESLFGRIRSFFTGTDRPGPQKPAPVPKPTTTTETKPTTSTPTPTTQTTNTGQEREPMSQAVTPPPTETFRASTSAAETVDQLGLLADLQGNWKGSGFNVMGLPDFVGGTKFRVMVNRLSETLTVSPIGGAIPNRGNTQTDIFFKGLHYLQDISDFFTHDPIHLEPGLWLNVPATTSPKKDASIVRMGSVPHGDSLMCVGTGFHVAGPPQFDVADPTPFTLDPTTGARINDTSEKYLKPFKDTPLPEGIRPEAMMNPNVLLSDAIEGLDVISTTVFVVAATPVGGIGGTPVTPPDQLDHDGGIVNMPFVVTNADANAMSSTFWINTVRRTDGTTFQQLQYTQTVILDFAVLGPDGETRIPIKWPHISVGTLVKQ